MILREHLASRRCGKHIVVLVVATVAARSPHNHLLASSLQRQKLILAGWFEGGWKVAFLIGTVRKGFVF